MMIKQKLLLLCGAFLLVPGLAAARGTGSHQWGRVPTHVTVPSHHQQVCDLSGVWKATPYSKAWGNKRFKVLRHAGTGLIEYSVQEFGMRGQAHEVISYNANKETLELFAYANPNIFFYASGKVGIDCRHISLFERYAGFATRKSQLTFIRH